MPLKDGRKNKENLEMETTSFLKLINLKTKCRVQSIRQNPNHNLEKENLTHEQLTEVTENFPDIIKKLNSLM